MDADRGATGRANRPDVSPYLQHHRVRSRPLVHRNGLEKGMWRDPDKKARKVVPVRFVQACVRGHVSDINWKLFVHGTEASWKVRITVSVGT